MEERLQQVLEFANYRQTLNNQLHKVKIKAEGLLMFAKNGGNFIVNQELICFLDYLVRTGVSSANILDSNNIPVKIDDLVSFLNDINKRYFEVTDDYLKEYQTIKKLRNVKSIIGIKDSE
jgi:predicted HTH transcriptional regulator